MLGVIAIPGDDEGESLGEFSWSRANFTAPNSPVRAPTCNVHTGQRRRGWWVGCGQCRRRLVVRGNAAGEEPQHHESGQREEGL